MSQRRGPDPADATPAPASAGGPPFLLATPGASRLADPARRAALVEAARAVLRERTGIEPEVRVSPNAAAGRAAAREAVAAGARLVVVAGGDGSVRTAAAALAGTGIPLGIVPAGTGNLLASALGIPRAPDRAIAALRTARERPIDVGRVTIRGGARAPSRPFLVAVGMGFDARVMAATSDRGKRALGVAAYFATAAAVAARLRPFYVRIIVDGTVHETDALAVLVTNAGELVPGLLRPRLPLVPDDGLLDVLVARGRGPLGGSRAAVELLLGRGVHTAIGPFAARMAARHVVVEAATPEPIEVDGDVVGSGAMTADVEPGALHVLVPA
jgi:diacylglycerol kinase family enzyme